MRMQRGGKERLYFDAWPRPGDGEHIREKYAIVRVRQRSKQNGSKERMKANSLYAQLLLIRSERRMGSPRAREFRGAQNKNKSGQRS